MNLHRFISGSALIGIALGSGISLASAATIANGGFEGDQSAGSITIYGAGTSAGPSFQGYTVFGPGTVGLVKNTFSDNVGTNNPNSGNFEVDLTGDTDAGVRQGIVTTASDLIAGQSYLLSFFLGNRVDNPNATTVGVSTTGTSGIFTDFTNNDFSGVVNSPNRYQQFSLLFTALGSTADIAFRLDTTGRIVNAGLDDISISAVTTPVPGPLAGAGIVPLLGFGLLAMRRRRQKLAA